MDWDTAAAIGFILVIVLMLGFIITDSYQERRKFVSCKDIGGKMKEGVIHCGNYSISDVSSDRGVGTIDFCVINGQPYIKDWDFSTNPPYNYTWRKACD